MYSQPSDTTTHSPSDLQQQQQQQQQQQLARGMVQPAAGMSIFPYNQQDGGGSQQCGSVMAQHGGNTQQLQQNSLEEQQRRLMFFDQAAAQQNQQQQRNAVPVNIQQQMQYAQQAAAAVRNQQFIFQQQPVATAPNLAVAQYGGFQGFPVTAMSFPASGAAMGIQSLPHAVSSMHQPMMNAHLVSAAIESQGSDKPQKEDKKEPPARDMPIRPLSAYNFYFRDERARILNDDQDDLDPDDTEGLERKKQQLLQQHMNKDRTKRRPHRKTHGKIGFTTLSKLIGKRWKELSDKKKQFYRDIAATDMDRYQRDVAEYNKGRLFQPTTITKTN